MANFDEQNTERPRRAQGTAPIRRPLMERPPAQSAVPQKATVLKVKESGHEDTSK